MIHEATFAVVHACAMQAPPFASYALFACAVFAYLAPPSLGMPLPLARPFSMHISLFAVVEHVCGAGAWSSGDAYEKQQR
jgi:hypothetical protein